MISEVKRYLAWEQVDLPGGVYRVENARWLPGAPDLTGYVDCTGMGQQIVDEITMALEILGERYHGTWVCWGHTVRNVCHGIAWLVS